MGDARVIAEAESRAGEPIRWDTLRVSERAHKRFAILTPLGRVVHFGLWPYRRGTFLDHQDERIRDAWWARHVTRETQRFADDPESPLYYTARILWSR